MNIIYGDLLDLFDDGNFDAIGHGCNCFCTMGSGIAGQINRRYPNAYNVDKETIKGDINKLGGYTYTDWYKGGRIYNLYTQYDFGGDGKVYLNYDALRLCMFKLNSLEKSKKIGLPLIGCGLAGGDEVAVLDIIERYLKNRDVTIVKFKERKWPKKAN